jgi:hypothetical protein
MKSRHNNSDKWKQACANSEDTVCINLDVMVHLKPSDEWESNHDDMREEAARWIQEVLIDAKFCAVESVHDSHPEGIPEVTGIYVRSAAFTNKDGE